MLSLLLRTPDSQQHLLRCLCSHLLVARLGEVGRCSKPREILNSKHLHCGGCSSKRTHQRLWKGSKYLRQHRCHRAKRLKPNTINRLKILIFFIIMYLLFWSHSVTDLWGVNHWGYPWLRLGPSPLCRPVAGTSDRTTRHRPYIPWPSESPEDFGAMVDGKSHDVSINSMSRTIDVIIYR